MRPTFPPVLTLAAACAGAPAAHAAAPLTITAAPTTEAATYPATVPMTFTVTRADGSEPLTVAYTTSDGTANSGLNPQERDFLPAGGTLSFAVGETTKTFTVTLNADRLDERDVETFTVTVDGAAPFTAEILDQDPFVAFPAVGSVGVHVDGEYTCDGGFYSLITVSGRHIVRCLGADPSSLGIATLTGPLTVEEADATTVRTFTIVRPDGLALSSPVIHDYELLDAEDAVLGSGSVTFNGGQVAADIALPVPGDDEHTGDRALAVRFRTPGGIGWQSAARLPLTVREDDPAPAPPTPEPTDGTPADRTEPAPQAPAAPATPAAPRSAPAPKVAAPLLPAAARQPLVAALTTGVGVDVTVARPTWVTARLMLSHRDRRALGLRYRTAGRAIVRADGRTTLRLKLRRSVRRKLKAQGGTVRMTVRLGGLGGAARTIPVTLTD